MTRKTCINFLRSNFGYLVRLVVLNMAGFKYTGLVGFRVVVVEQNRHELNKSPNLTAPNLDPLAKNCHCELSSEFLSKLFLESSNAFSCIETKWEDLEKLRSLRLIKPCRVNSFICFSSVESKLRVFRLYKSVKILSSRLMIGFELRSNVSSWFKNLNELWSIFSKLFAAKISVFKCRYL
ncbi:hypothetical protein BpHYR1_030454 [Brachionus plicatilis]|uniref:Uncharacterized protein n=1 Tax=Brachionus plicatilis TaxID=10195 RepID=A0A3M7QTM4_BRAPC|nr:hypothetical protein BpHYR1_030454 [Brachionus plicatilis]